MTLKWSGASGTTVDVYRNGPLLLNTPNDGLYTNSRTFAGSATYTYTVCQTGTTTCSNQATVQFGQGSPPPNAPPTAAFTAGCTGLTCAFTDGSGDSEGPVATWQWAFGDDGLSVEQNPFHAYSAPGIYTVTLTVTDQNGAPGSASRQVTAKEPGTTGPVADFSSSCVGLTCVFTDGSTGDGTLISSWDFGDNGGTSSATSPSYTYTAGGTYTVTLTITDAGGLTDQRSAPVTVAAPAIVLSVTGRTDATKQYMTLKWTGASGATVDVYRNGPLLTSTPNDGLYTNSRNFTASATYTYKVCQVGTSTCSNEATVAF